MPSTHSPPLKQGTSLQGSEQEEIVSSTISKVPPRKKDKCFIVVKLTKNRAGYSSFALEKYLHPLTDLLCHPRIPAGEGTFQDMLANLAHQPKIELKIMKTGNLQAQVFIGFEEMTDIGF